MLTPVFRHRLGWPLKPHAPFSFPAILLPRARGRLPFRRAVGYVIACSIIAAVLLSACGPACSQTVVAASPSASPIDRPIATFVSQAAHRFGIPAAWVRAVIETESGGNVGAVSPKGAMGLMQIMPQTWTDLQSRYGFGTDPFDPHDNIMAGAAYLSELLDRYGQSGIFAAYNAGPERYQEHLTTGRPLPSETQAYVDTVARLLHGPVPTHRIFAVAAASSWTGAPVFPRHDDGMSNEPSSPTRDPLNLPLFSVPTANSAHLVPHSKGLFVQLSTGRSSS
ncbi:MAG: lytic transglycosylase domain-containing protein [Stellaceae bacterium]